MKETVETLKKNLNIQEQFEILLAEKDKRINNYRAEIEELKKNYTEQKELYTKKEEEFHKLNLKLTMELSIVRNTKDELDFEKNRILFPQTMHRINEREAKIGKHSLSI